MREVEPFPANHNIEYDKWLDKKNLPSLPGNKGTIKEFLSLQASIRHFVSFQNWDKKKLMVYRCLVVVVKVSASYPISSLVFSVSFL